MPDETIAVNRRARHEYAITETVEAGLVLTGTEIKSIRAHKANLAEAYARIEGGEAWLVGAHIAPYAEGNRWNHEPTRTRKLLLHRGQIVELIGLTKQKGLTLIPLRLYIRNGMAKLELGVARGKKAHDKRRTIAERDMRRELARETKQARVKL
ncbi:MAG TPA: SsrA-binding protein SmpB [Candidatus Limnocylindria bacterium]|nr:SsrA-binding protein SmpB [Candidatus Limnocylindria bacterium]